MLYSATAETVGVEHEFLTPPRSGALALVRTEDLKGALFHPTDGYINPADVTQAAGQGARMAGCTIERRSRSTPIAGPAANGSSPASAWWKGRQPGSSGEDLRNPCRRTCRHRHRQPRAAHRAALGIKIPAIPVEHQYIVTEPDRRWSHGGARASPNTRSARRRCEMVCARGTRRLDPWPL